MSEEIKELLGKKINKYVITKYISSGGFGHVVEAYDAKNKEFKALKIPKKEKNGQQVLLDEAKIYKNLNTSESTGILVTKMIKNNDQKIMVMDLLGYSLEKLLYKRKQFRLKTIILLTIEILKILKSIHAVGYIHRDIKPDNFVMDKSGEKLYCIDFGLAKKKYDIFKQVPNKFVGTCRFASKSAHEGSTQSFKDDLESVLYLIIYLYRSHLPWMNLKYKDKQERNKKVYEIKSTTSIEELCDKLPKEFIVFAKYLDSLEFNEPPLYDPLIKMFEKLYKKKNYTFHNYEWIQKK